MKESKTLEFKSGKRKISSLYILRNYTRSDNLSTG